MIMFFASVGLLILGYVIYGRLVDRLFGADPARKTPAETMADGVDYVKMPPWKIFLIQLLNIAGLGPIYGAILGALYGPVALVWIVFGCIFAGAVHDYFSGMLSVRHDGESIPDVVGHHLGNGFKQFMRGFSVLLLILVGVVFFLGPAELLASLTGIDKPIDETLRFGYPPLHSMMTAFGNMGEILYGMAHNKEVDQEVDYKYVVELIMSSSEAGTDPLPVDYPKEYEDNIWLKSPCKVDGQHYVIPIDHSTVVGGVSVGADSLEDAIAECKEIASQVKAPGLYYDEKSFDRALDQLKEAKKLDVGF